MQPDMCRIGTHQRIAAAEVLGERCCKLLDCGPFAHLLGDEVALRRQEGARTHIRMPFTRSRRASRCLRSQAVYQGSVTGVFPFLDAPRTLLRTVSVAVISLLLSLRKACSMSDLRSALTSHSTKYDLSPSFQTLPILTFALPCWCFTRFMLILTATAAKTTRACGGVSSSPSTAHSRPLVAGTTRDGTKNDRARLVAAQPRSRRSFIRLTLADVVVLADVLVSKKPAPVFSTSSLFFCHDDGRPKAVLTAAAACT